MHRHKRVPLIFLAASLHNQLRTRRLLASIGLGRHALLLAALALAIALLLLLVALFEEFVLQQSLRIEPLGRLTTQTTLDKVARLARQRLYK